MKLFPSNKVPFKFINYLIKELRPDWRQNSDDKEMGTAEKNLQYNLITL